MELADSERPTTIHAEDELAPRAPWSYLRPGLRGGFSRWGWGLMTGWLLVLLGPVLGWAGHLRRAAGWSALPSHWGERVSARDVWELWENGGLQHRLANSPTVHLFGLGLVIVLWCGWRMQAERVGLKARLGSWLLGALDTVLIGFLPVGLLAWLGDVVLTWLGGLGIDGLGWIAFFGRPLLWMAAVAALNLQWWFCRLGRAAGPTRGYRAHLSDCFLSLWTHPVQWSLLSLGGAALRSLPPFLVLILAWRMGGGTPCRVGLFLALQLAVTLLNGWLMGWLLRATALFYAHDAAVRTARAALKDLSRDAIAS
jgi:hypothetical protein